MGSGAGKTGPAFSVYSPPSHPPAWVSVFLFYNFHMFIFGCIGSCLLHGPFSSCSEWGLLSGCSAQAPGCNGFPCGQAKAVGRVGCGSGGCRALEHRPNSCGARAYLVQGMWDLPGSGIKPMSPALAGGFFTTEPPATLVLFVCLNICLAAPGLNCSIQDLVP